MAITRPTTKTVVSTTTWGFPVADELNRLASEGSTNLADLTALQNMLNGILTPVWKALPLTANYASFGSNYAAPSYAVHGTWVLLRGLIRYTGTTAVTATSDFVTGAPTEIRPVQNIQLIALVQTGSAAGVTPARRFEVFPNGTFRIYMSATATLAADRWIALDGLRYNTQPN